MTQSSDNFDNALKEAPAFSMPAGLEEKIMARVTAEMEKDARTQKGGFRLTPLKIAASLAGLAVALSVLVYLQQPKPGEVKLAGIPDAVESTHTGTAIIPDETAIEIAPEEIIPVAANNATASGSDVTIAPSDTMLISQAGYSDYLGEIGKDPLASDELDSDPMMMMIGF